MHIIRVPSFVPHGNRRIGIDNSIGKFHQGAHPVAVGLGMLQEDPGERVGRPRMLSPAGMHQGNRSYQQ